MTEHHPDCDCETCDERNHPEELFDGDPNPIEDYDREGDR